MPAATILVIGSDLQSRDLLARGVKEVGYSTVVVGSLPDALALVPSLRPQAIMLDIDDAEPGVLDLLHQLRLESPIRRTWCRRAPTMRGSPSRLCEREHVTSSSSRFSQRSCATPSIAASP